ncbi:hypothetical protein [Litchfieldella rifensis]|uniref:Uncharacterized protein n=1 Tax=Litchfieldella rifensis TaxID=762643 RepID=A0ABV7LVN1_9GAMM
MFQRQERRILEVTVWTVAAVLAPYTTFVISKYSDTVFIGALFLNILLFAAGMLCTRINNTLDVVLEDEGADHREVGDAMALETAQVGGLRVLRVAGSSPLRGQAMEKGIIRSINGGFPTSAEEANQLLVPGKNEIEWVARTGKPMTSTIFTKESDLQVQVEQITPRKT